MKITTKDSVKDIDVTTVTLIKHYGEHWKMWNCPICKTPVFRFKGRMISIEPGEVPTEIPMLVQCSNRSCKHNYLINKIIPRFI